MREAGCERNLLTSGGTEVFHTSLETVKEFNFTFGDGTKEFGIEDIHAEESHDCGSDIALVGVGIFEPFPSGLRYQIQESSPRTHQYFLFDHRSVLDRVSEIRIHPFLNSTTKGDELRLCFSFGDVHLVRLQAKYEVLLFL